MRISLVDQHLHREKENKCKAWQDISSAISDSTLNKLYNVWFFVNALHRFKLRLIIRKT